MQPTAYLDLFFEQPKGTIFPHLCPLSERGHSELWGLEGENSVPSSLQTDSWVWDDSLHSIGRRLTLYSTFPFLFVIWNKVSLCSPGQPWTLDPHTSASQVLRLQLWTAITELLHAFKYTYFWNWPWVRGRLHVMTLTGHKRNPMELINSPKMIRPVSDACGVSMLRHQMWIDDCTML